MPPALSQVSVWSALQPNKRRYSFTKQETEAGEDGQGTCL